MVDLVLYLEMRLSGVAGQGILYMGKPQAKRLWFCDHSYRGVLRIYIFDSLFGKELLWTRHGNNYL